MKFRVTVSFKLPKEIEKKIASNFYNSKLQLDVDREVTKGEIINLLAAGRSPVASVGRLVKYSETYRQQILGKIKFYTNKKTGGTFPVLPPGTVKKDKNGVEYTPLVRGKVKREKFSPGLGVGKAITPVNLKLTGEMQSYLTTSKGIDSIKIGIRASAPQFVKEKAEWNNLGTDKMPARRFIPIADNNETFTVSVMRKLKNLFARRLAEVLSK